jgi:hypothetical protein
MPGYNLPSVTLLYINQALLHFACDLSGDARCPHGPRNQLVKVTGLNGWVNWGIDTSKKINNPTENSDKSRFYLFLGLLYTREIRNLRWRVMINQRIL